MKKSSIWRLIGVFALCVAGCGKEGPPTPKKSGIPAVAVEEIATVSFVRELALTGTVEPAVFATLSSAAEGPVVFADVREGDRVTSGQELFRIGRRTSADAAVASAEAEVERQRGYLERMETLVGSGGVAVDQLDAARVMLERARAHLATAREQSGDYALEAPWDGVVSKIHAALGNYVAPRLVLAEIYDPESLVLRFAVPEEHALAVETGSMLTAVFDAFPEKQFTLEVNRAFGDIDRRLRLRRFEAGLPDGETFLPGMFARLRVVIDSVADALTVPEACVLKDAEGSFVFIVEEGKAVRRPLTTGQAQDGRVLVSEGLAAGEQVVVAGFQNLRSGSPVRLADAKSGPQGQLSASMKP